ncbi:DUF3397 domain-containing protein [Bacillus sp. JCM 19034]|uniref:DUF3397 domain-containing protein n=1 Tax=Bacillus sp. JCM 19034 TaxID=1481928 RepID=UPI000784EEEE|nr:DUF3397 domain-containing protein [Bacillus sp. JCM 19034]
MQLFAWFIATLVTLPIVSWYFLYWIYMKRKKDRKKAIRFASDWSTILFIASVHFILSEIFGHSLLLLLLAVIVIIAISFTWLHWYVSGDIQIRKLVRGIWRFNFYCFFYFYISHYFSLDLS